MIDPGAADGRVDSLVGVRRIEQPIEMLVTSEPGVPAARLCGYLSCRSGIGGRMLST